MGDFNSDTNRFDKILVRFVKNTGPDVQSYHKGSLKSNIDHFFIDQHLGKYHANLCAYYSYYEEPNTVCEEKFSTITWYNRLSMPINHAVE